MPYSAPMPYQRDDQDATTVRWVVLFVLLSLVAHALFILVLLFLSKHIPSPRMDLHPVPPTVSLTLIPPPQPVAAPPPPKHIFMPTPAQKNALHKETLVESDHDTQLASHSKAPRKPDSMMPDVVSKTDKASSLESSPSAPPTQKPEAATTPPTPKQEQAKPSPTPPQPQQPPQPKTEAQKPQPPQPTTKPPPPNPTQTPPTQVQPPPAVDENGLPVLPMLNAPTLAPQTSASAQAAQMAAPPPMMPIVPANVQGRAGMSGQPTPAAMKTDLGAYKAQFYAAVGSRWYQKLDPLTLQTIGVGTVRIQYTISPDGIVTYRVLDSGGGSMTILCTISQNSIRDTSPFLKFPDSMLKQFPNGYTDEFSFSIY